MPIKTSSGKWKWGNVERSSKKELVQTVYGIWKKNGGKGSFSDFLKGTHESIEEQKERYFVTDLDYNKHIKPVLDILKKWKKMEIISITKNADDKSMKRFGIYKGRSIEDIVALAAVHIDKADKEIFFNQINSGEKGMGKYLIDRMIEYFKKNKNGCDHISWFSDPGSGEKLKDFYRTNFPEAEETEEKNEWWQTSKFTLKLKESYEPPYTLDTIKQKYGDEVYRKLRDDPVHRFRAETGIEVIHKEPTRDEFERIVKNWDLMTPEQKKQSDEFSMKQFGSNNKNRIDLLRQEYDFEVGDKVKVRHGIRCKQAGHSGKIVRIDPPNKYGWSSFIVKFDKPELGTMGFFSNDLEKIDSIKEAKTLGKDDFEQVAELCRRVAKYKVTDEDGERVSVAFSGNCGIFAYYLFDFLCDRELFENADFEFGFFFIGCKTKADIWKNDNVDLNHVILGIDGHWFDGEGELSKETISSWNGKLFVFDDDLDEIVHMIREFTVPTVQDKKLAELFKKEWKQLLPVNKEIKKMTNEAHEIHLHNYPERLQSIIERIVKGNEDYKLDHAYFNKEGKFIWMRNSKGYFHVFKPVKFVKTPGMTKPFGFKDLILKDNGMLEEIDRLRFYDGNEGLKYLKDKYHLELKTIS